MNEVNSQKTGVEIFLPRAVSAEEFSEIRRQFDMAILGGATDSFDIFTLLFKYFEENNFKQELIERYAGTFWELFVRVSWHIIQTLNPPTFAQIVAYTLPSVIHLPIDFKSEIVAYLSLKTPEEARNIHQQINRKITSLDLPLSFSATGKKLLLSQVVKKLSSKTEGTDLSKFEMLSTIEKLIFPDSSAGEENKKYETERVMELIDVLSFFYSDPNNIQDYITAYHNKLANQIEIEIELDEDSQALLGANVIRFKAEKEEQEKKRNKSESSESEEDFVVELLKQKKNFVTWSQEPSVLRSMLIWLKETEDKVEARKKLEDLLQKELGQNALTDIEIALAIVNLDEFLNKNNYPGDDLVHYDEKAGEFRWGK